MRRHRTALILPALLVPLAALMGGWAIVTMDDVPDFAEAGKPLPLSFMVRQHGAEPMKGIRPTLEARSGATVVRADARPGTTAGQYVATLALSQPGDWTLTVNSGHGASKVTLLPIQVVPAGARPPAPPSDYERGRRLFVGKGCIGCHTREEGGLKGGETIGPMLTGKRWQAEFLARFLANPAANPTNTGTFRMPNLGLKPAEISALTAFLNGGR